MAIDVNFYTFDKKPNSTKRPAGIGTTYKCNLIEPTSFTAPYIALAVPAKPTSYNYAYIPEFSRYYFIQDWAYSAGLWKASLSVDVLASYRDYIGSQKQYILRSAARSDGNIVDTMYPTKNDVLIVGTNGSDMESGESNPFKYSLTDGLYVVGIINGDSSAVGCVSYYSFTNAQFREFCAKLMGTTDWMYSGIGEISLELTKVLFNPFQYVASCMWFPIVGIGGSAGTVKYGWWDLGVSANKIDGSLSGGGMLFNVPKHPQVDRGAYLNGAPFSRHYLDWPCFGRIPLDSNILKDVDKLVVDNFIDPVSGICTLRINVGGIPIYTQQTKIGVPIQIAQMASDYFGAAGNAISAVRSALSFDVAGAFKSIGNAVNSAMPSLSTTGSNGSISAFIFEPKLVTEFYKVVDDDNEHLGRPLCQDVIPSSIPGYMLCADVEIEAPCTKAELDNIVSTMEGGFYYE